MAWQPQSWSSQKTGGRGAGPSRKYFGEERAVGVLVDWQHKGGKSFGWIVPIHGIPADMPEAVYHGGDIYVHKKDIQEPRPGAVVTFRPYVDTQGLGAEACVNRNVLRLSVPRDSPRALTLPVVEANPVAKYLPSSVFYPDLEHRSVTLRKYLWDSPMTVFEFWGEPEAILKAVDEIGLLAHPDAEALVSYSMVRHEPQELVREVPADVFPGVPPRFRVALALGGGDGVHERLRILLGS